MGLSGVLLSVIVLSAGCFRDAASLDRDEENHPLMKKARDLRDGGEFDAAIDTYQVALQKKPELVRAHLELAVLYESHLGDYVRAIYHYNFYLDARPDTKKKQLLEDAIRHAEQKFVARFPLRPDVERAMEQIQEQNKNLKSENMLLKHQVADLTLRISGESSSEGALPPEESVAVQTDETTPDAIQTATRYKVEKGDTLMRISEKVYGNPRGWVKILEANKEKLPRAEKLKVDMELIIPR